MSMYANECSNGKVLLVIKDSGASKATVKPFKH